MFEKNKSCTLEALLSSLITRVSDENYYEYNDFYVYSEENKSEYSLEDEVYVTDMPTIDDNDEELFPEAVSKLNLYTAYSGEAVVDVICYMKKEREDAALNDYITALNYYYTYDTMPDYTMLKIVWLLQKIIGLKSLNERYADNRSFEE